MVNLDPTWHPTLKLNVIAGAVDRASADPFPDDISRDQVEEICYAIADLYGKFVAELTSETTLSLRESQTWVLRNLVYPHAEPLSYEAIGVYIWSIGRSQDGDPLSRTIVMDYYERAAGKFARAESTLMRAGTPPYAQDLFDDPAVMWVDRRVADRLRLHLGEDESISALIDRLLDATEGDASLEQVLREYLAAGVGDYAAVDTVYDRWDQHLRLILQKDETADLPSAITDVDRLSTTAGSRSVRIIPRPDPSGAESHLVLCRGGPDAVAIEDGLDRLARAIEAAQMTPYALVGVLREAGEAALGVADDPVGGGAHLYALFDRASSMPFELAMLDRLELDDRILKVSRITTLGSPLEEDPPEAVRWLWVDDSVSDLAQRELPDDDTELRESFPRAVLWTA